MTITANLAARLGEAVGPQCVVAAPEELAVFAVSGLVPKAVVRPASDNDVAGTVRFALAEKLALLPLGSRSKLDVGAPLSKYDLALDMTGLREIVHYDGGDLTLSVDAGLPLRELEAFLKQHGQFLPLAVPCFESTTAGGAIASGIDSILRQQYGSARDFLIGAEFVDGTGQLCKSGGRVVKNVTGYDLHKLLIGSLGTLGVITRLNFRTFPLPAASGGHVSRFVKLQDALEFRRSIERAGLPLASVEVFSPSIAEILQAILRQASDAGGQLFGAGRWHVYCSYEGNDVVVRRIAADVEKAARSAGAEHSELLNPGADESLGGLLREAFEWLRWAAPAVLICRLALPGITADLLAEISKPTESASLRSGILLRAAGVAYFSAMAEDSSESAMDALSRVAANVKSIALANRGAASILHAPEVVKRKLAGKACEDLNLNMQLRVKKAFDPSGIFAPGRVVGGL